MEQKPVTRPQHRAVLEELKRREPLFHRPEVASSPVMVSTSAEAWREKNTKLNEVARMNPAITPARRS